MNISRSATFAYDLAKQPSGYLVLYDEVIEILRDEGLITIRDVGDGFVIAKAVPPLVPARAGRRSNGRRDGPQSFERRPSL